VICWPAASVETVTRMELGGLKATPPLAPGLKAALV
jgi:hypothetical protein